MVSGTPKWNCLGAGWDTQAGEFEEFSGGSALRVCAWRGLQIFKGFSAVGYS